MSEVRVVFLDEDIVCRRCSKEAAGCIRTGERWRTETSQDALANLHASKDLL